MKKLGGMMEININKYEPKDVIRFMREATNLSQKAFAESIGKKEDWTRKNEYGITNYYFKDLVQLAKIHGFTITIKKNEKEK